MASTPTLDPTRVPHRYRGSRRRSAGGHLAGRSAARLAGGGRRLLRAEHLGPHRRGRHRARHAHAARDGAGRDDRHADARRGRARRRLEHDHHGVGGSRLPLRCRVRRPADHRGQQQHPRVLAAAAGGGRGGTAGSGGGGRGRVGASRPRTARPTRARVRHEPTGRSLRYGALVDRASRLPVPTEVTLKEPDSFTLLGRDVARLDIPEKVQGRAGFGIDVQRPGMLVAPRSHAARCSAARWRRTTRAAPPPSPGCAKWSR